MVEREHSASLTTSKLVLDETKRILHTIRPQQLKFSVVLKDKEGNARPQGESRARLYNSIVSNATPYLKQIGYSVGINHYNNHDPFDTIHAEVDAVFQLKKNEKVKKVNMLVCRVNRNKHELCNAKPCIHCMRYIERNLKRKNFRLKNRRCYYTDEEGNFKYINI